MQIPAFQEYSRFLLHSLSCLTAALEYVHSESVAHHDIKPANILFGDGRLYLADFGLSTVAKDQGDFTEATRVNPEYTAPEAMNQGYRTQASDVFSLGCIFVECLTYIMGSSPSHFKKYRALFTGDSSFYRTTEKTREWLGVLQERQQHMSYRDSFFSIPFDLIRQMLSKSPADRPTAHNVLLGFPKCTCSCRPFLLRSSS